MIIILSASNFHEFKEPRFLHIFKKIPATKPCPEPIQSGSNNVIFLFRPIFAKCSLPFWFSDRNFTLISSFFTFRPTSINFHIVFVFAYGFAKCYLPLRVSEEKFYTKFLFLHVSTTVSPYSYYNPMFRKFHFNIILIYAYTCIS